MPSRQQSKLALLSSRDATTVERPTSGGGADDDGEKTTEATSQRSHVIAEIINTEKDYVRDLQWVVTQYVDPIEKRKLLGDADFK